MNAFRLSSNPASASSHKLQSKLQFNADDLGMTVARWPGRQDRVDDGVAINGKVMLYE
ncbi:uncharacterized protein METZ01_LOCUS379115 [marine metagenome]|uniref:Uncharacterized protein n=1 Tax=marine metagenome TaxID=408172 RepID=A0A382TXL5_9ZZZZ